MNPQDDAPQTTEGPGEPDREGITVEGDGPDVHTKPGEGHPGGEGERSDRDIGGPRTSGEGPGSEDVSGGAPGSASDSRFESHGDADSDEDIAPLGDSGDES
ncbi:MAG: hypothetical protein ACR2J6_02200 [Thermoleophilaceae bacterium]